VGNLPNAYETYTPRVGNFSAMCGIVAVLATDDGRPAADPKVLRRAVAEAVAALGAGQDVVAGLAAAADRLRVADAAMRGLAGVLGVREHPQLRAELTEALRELNADCAELERRLDEGSLGLDGPALEAANHGLVDVKDLAWGIERDRLRTAEAVLALAGADGSRPALGAMLAVQIALSALDRLEVRGRDSAGISLLVHGHGLDIGDDSFVASLRERHTGGLFTSGAVELAGSSLAFVYKAAAEIGELGDNTAVLRRAIASDQLLHRAVSEPGARCTVLAHTRWASVGIISEPNAHPVNSAELESGGGATFVAAALNGDVDNHADLKASVGLRLAPEITTDAKVIPTLVSRAALSSPDMTEAFRRTVTSFEGSVAIAAIHERRPDEVLLALRGSGQALYVGIADGAFVVASEPYGVVEETSTFLRLDGETPARPEQASTSRGQVVVLDGLHAGTLAGIRRMSYDGTDLPVHAHDLSRAEITTRDIDRGAAPHFLLKEITEAPLSLRKTLRGHVREQDGRLHVHLTSDTIAPALDARLRSGGIRRVLVIGQGTAAVAGQSMVRLLRELTAGSSLVVEASTATELSGFGLAVDLSDTLVIAVSQSGTTTDTNRTVDLARSRGAMVVAIVNRRNSDLTDKSDGVLYTSDGRDVEMSVASTKAFYAQVAAGALLACTIADRLGVADPRQVHELLTALRDLPDALTTVLSRREQIAHAAQQFATSRRYWAVVGNGSNIVAAEEVRIKLSELCYKSIACDITEDKKHIDLSSEPMILVCAAGLIGSNADDVAKEVAIYRAHKAAPIVIATEGEERFNAALAVISVPRVHPSLGFVLSAMAGHLFGYEAALAIDAQARGLREARAVIDDVISSTESGDAVLSSIAEPISIAAQRYFDTLRSGNYDGHLEASTAVRLASMFRYASGLASLDAFQLEHGRVGTPQVVLEELVSALTRAIDELTRPIDAIKHQAKTVTVGISRSDEGLLGNRFVREVLATGTPRDRLGYRILKTLADLEPAVAAVLGSTRYRIVGDTIEIVDRSGVSVGLASRVERSNVLRGTKRRVAAERDVQVARGASDGRTIVMIPELKGNETTGITLLHVQLADRLEPAVARGVLAYRGRYEALRDYVTETEPDFRDDRLGDVAVIDLLTVPILDLAERWRS
jgi:glutamine---fructose-6-phosphate transaminase (isomerizing)